MVITRWPRAWSAALRRTVSVVFPLCFRPITATMGGRRIRLREPEVLGCIHVHEHHGGIAMTRDDVVGHPDDSYIVEESDHPSVIGIEAAFDGGHARRRVEAAQRLDAATRAALR